MARPRKNPKKAVKIDEALYETIAKQAYQEGRYIGDHAEVLLQIGMQYYRPSIPKTRGRKPK